MRVLAYAYAVVALMLAMYGFFEYGDDERLLTVVFTIPIALGGLFYILQVLRDERE